MKQLFKTGTKKFVVDNVPTQLCDDNEILIEVANSLISSGTEVMGVKKDNSGNGAKLEKVSSNFSRAYNFLTEKGATELIRKLKARENIATSSGYSIAGIVKRVGKNITNFKPGDRVAAGGSGIATHAEVVAVPKNLVVKLPDNVGFREASFTTIGSIALQGVRQGKVQVGENVVVIGLGLIGIIAAQMLKASGCRVIGVDLSTDKVKIAKSLGIDEGLLAGQNTVVEDVIKLTENIGADAVLICAASSSSIIVNDAMNMVRKKGRVVIVGAVGMDINRSPFYQKEVEFTISCSYGPGRYDDNYELKGQDYPLPFVRWTENRNMQSFVWMLSKSMIDVQNLITDEFSIENATKAYDKILSKPEETLAVLLKYPEVTEEEKWGTKVFIDNGSINTTKKDTVNLSIIGAGGFASRTYLPYIFKKDNVKLVGIANKTGKSAKKIAADFQAQYCTTDYNEILKDNNTEAVIIASRHNLHYKMAADSLSNDKHVLLEKPMGITIEEIDNLMKVAEGKKNILGVGYNRRYSPLSVAAKKAVKNEIGPVFINYRVNAGFIPEESWVQDKSVGGGRIIGEACHFFDFFNFIIESNLESISVEKIERNKSTVVADDNFAATIKYEDGSVCVLNYISIGSKELNKEYIEIFVNGKSIILNDFKELQYFGFNKTNKKLKQINKGQKEQLNEFINRINGKSSDFISINDSYLATRMAIEVDKMLS